LREAYRSINNKNRHKFKWTKQKAHVQCA
jgi:hypothetical protein